jgi:zinc transport system substrate-binding protein
VASLYPLAFVSEEIGGGRVEVIDLTPAGAEPHDLELTPDQVAALARAELTVYLGGGFQPAVEDALGDAAGATLDVLDALRGSDRDDGYRDPHVWLDPALFAEIASLVADHLADVEPRHAREFEANLDRLETRLSALDGEYRSGLAECARHELVTSHEAFGHLATRYGLEQMGIAGQDPEAEPAPQTVAEVARLARARGVTTIFSETLVSPRIARTIADEIGAETGVLDPLESDPGGTRDYFSVMRANLRSMREALGCR